MAEAPHLQAEAPRLQAEAEPAPRFARQAPGVAEGSAVCASHRTPTAGTQVSPSKSLGDLMFSSGPPPGACAGQLDVGGPAALAWTAPPPPGRRRPRASTSFCGVSRTAEHEVVKMQKAVGFDKEKCSCNICLTLVCSFISAKWSINQSGMVFRFLRGSVINLVPVLMKNGGGRPRDSENVYITREVIMACNSATHLPTRRRGPGGQARTPPAAGRGTERESVPRTPRAHPVAGFVTSAPFLQIPEAPLAGPSEAVPPLDVGASQTRRGARKTGAQRWQAEGQDLIGDTRQP